MPLAQCFLYLCVGSTRGAEIGISEESQDPASAFARESYCRSYSPLLTRLSTVNPAFLASVTESGLSLMGELKVERILRTGFLQAGQLVKGFAESGRRSVNLPPHTLQAPSHSSYS
jgi:hypothetical protein